jgi:hypothetical protein
VLTSQYIAILPKTNKRRRNKDEIREFCSRKMSWLTEKLGEVGDDEFAVLYALIMNYLSNGSDWCNPTDKMLGQACGKSERTIRRITAGLKAKGHIDKKKRLGASQYTFIGLNEDRSHMAGLNETRPATYDRKTCHAWPEERPPVGRTEPSLEPSIKPSLGNGSAWPSPLNGEASASPENGFHGGLVKRPGQDSIASPSLDSPIPPKAVSLPPPRSAPSCPPREECERLLRGLANNIRANARTKFEEKWK